MKRNHKKSFSLPTAKPKDNCYISKCITIAKRGCYNSRKQLRIDQGFGDYNMNLFRLRKKRQYVRDIPSAFTPEFRELIRQRSVNPRQRRIATQHNSQIDKILQTPKQVYLEQIRLEKQAIRLKTEQEKRKHQYIKGYDEQIRQFNEHLSFEYLSEHQSKNWFKIKDNSSLYEPPVYEPPLQTQFSTPKAKPKKRKGFIFISDQKRKTNYLNKS